MQGAGQIVRNIGMAFGQRQTVGQGEDDGNTVSKSGRRAAGVVVVWCLRLGIPRGTITCRDVKRLRYSLVGAVHCIHPLLCPCPQREVFVDKNMFDVSNSAKRSLRHPKISDLTVYVPDLGNLIWHMRPHEPVLETSFAERHHTDCFGQ